MIRSPCERIIGRPKVKMCKPKESKSVGWTNHARQQLQSRELRCPKVSYMGKGELSDAVDVPQTYEALFVISANKPNERKWTDNQKIKPRACIPTVCNVCLC